MSAIETLYAPLIERDLAAIPAAVRRFRESHSSDELFLAVARFAILAYAPSEHGKHAVLSCLATHELRQSFGERFDAAVTECAIYAAASRQPWSEPPILEPPPVEADQRGDLGELLEAMERRDRLRGERWLAKRLQDADLAADYFAAAARAFDDLGHKLIVATAAWKLAGILGAKGRFAALRIAIWEMTSSRDQEYLEQGKALSAEALLERLIGVAVSAQGSLVHVYPLFLFDAALEVSVLVSDEGVARRVRDSLTNDADDREGSEGGDLGSPGEVPVYRLARDYGACLTAFAVAARLRIRYPAAPLDRFVAAARYNLEQGPSFEEWSFA